MDTTYGCRLSRASVLCDVFVLISGSCIGTWGQVLACTIAHDPCNFDGGITITKHGFMAKARPQVECLCGRGQE